MSNAGTKEEGRSGQNVLERDTGGVAVTKGEVGGSGPEYGDPSFADPDAGLVLTGRAAVLAVGTQDRHRRDGPEPGLAPGQRDAGPHAGHAPRPRTHALPEVGPTVALSSRKEMVVQLKRSAGSQPFSPLQWRTALPRERGTGRKT